MKSLLANILFWMGDLVSRVMIRFDIPGLYRVYNKLMTWSDKLKPWPKVEDDATRSIE
jgi:hypothetical protein